VKEISGDPDQFLSVGRTNTSHTSDFRKSGVKKADVGANTFKLSNQLGFQSAAVHIRSM